MKVTTNQPSLDASPRAELRDYLYFADAEGGLPPRTVEMLGRGEVGTALLAAWRTAHFGGRLPHRLKELVRLHLTGFDPECSKRALVEGVTHQTIADLGNYQASSLLTDREKVALQYADWFKNDAVDSDSVFATLKTVFDDEEIIEIGKFCALVLGMERFLVSVGAGPHNQRAPE